MADLRRTIVVNVQDRELDQHIRKVRQSGQEAERLGGRFSRLGGVIAGAFSVAALSVFASQLGRISKELFNLSTTAEETASKFRTVFGSSSDQVDRFLTGFANMAGLTRTQGREFTATLGGIAKGFGESVEGAAAFSTEVLKLAGDVASFNNVPIEDALRAIQSGLIGEQEPLRRFGVLLSEARVQAFAASEAGGKLTSELSEQQKVMARLAVITKDLTAGSALGDLERTQDSTANTTRRLRAEASELVEEFSRGLIPSYQELAAAGRRILDNVRDLADGFGGTFTRGILAVTEYIVDFGFQTGRAAGAMVALVDAMNLVGSSGAGGAVSFLFDSLLQRVKDLGVFLQVSSVALLEFRALLSEGAAQLSDITGSDDLAESNRKTAAALRERAELIREAMEDQRRADFQAKRDREERRKSLEEFLATFNKVEEATSGGGSGSGGGDREALATAQRALEKVQQAQRLAAAFSERERKALQDVVAAQEQVALLKDLQKTLGEEAVKDELRAAQAQLEAARKALSSAEAYRDAVRAAADAFNGLAARGAAGPTDFIRPPQGSFESQFGIEGGLVSDSMLRGVKNLNNEVEKLEGNLKRTAKNGENVQETFEGLALSIRTVTRVADIFGDLNENVREFANGVADAIDNLSRLDITRVQSVGGETSFIDFSQIPQLIGGVAGITSAVISLGNLLFDSSQQEREESRRLRQALRDSAHDFKKAVEDAFSGGRVAEDVSQQAINAARSIFNIARNAPGLILAAQGETIISQLESLALPGFETLRRDIELRFEQLVRDTDPRDFATGRITPDELIAQAIRELLGSESKYAELLDKLAAGVGDFTNDVAGAVEQMRFFTNFMGEEGTAALQRFTDFLLNNVDGLTPALEAMLKEASALDLSTEEGRNRLAEIVRIIASSFPQFLGGLDSGELEQILNELKALAEQTPSPAQGDEPQFTRSVQIARSITEIQANELIAIQETALFVLRQILSAVETRPTFSAPDFSGFFPNVPSSGPTLVTNQVSNFVLNGIEVNGYLTDEQITEAGQKLAAYFEEQIRRLARGQA
jgi:hypothetical protein